MQAADFRAVAGTDAWWVHGPIRRWRWKSMCGGLYVRGLNFFRGEVARVHLVEAHQRGKFGPF